MENVQFTFNDKHQLFAQLLAKTAGIPHGRILTEQEDDNGMVWEFLLPISRQLAGRMLWEAKGNELTTPAAERAEMDHLLSLLPAEDSFIIFSGDGTHLWSLYQTKDRYYVMRADGVRYYQLQTRNYHQSDAGMAVYDTLRQLYGYTDGAPTLPALPDSDGVEDPTL